ncbi:MAG: aldo/keto reductase [Clostridia bacterium]
MAEIIEQSRIPKRTLVDGSKVPAIGLGTFGSDKYNSDQIAEAVYGGIRAGYRMIDCASVYQNENRIGESIERVLKEGIVDRADLFITSKVWNDMHNRVKESCEKSLKDLRVSYLDLYLVHWPFPNYHAPGCDGDSRNPDSRPFSVTEFLNTWRQCEALV